MRPHSRCVPGEGHARLCKAPRQRPMRKERYAVVLVEWMFAAFSPVAVVP